MVKCFTVIPVMIQKAADVLYGEVTINDGLITGCAATMDELKQLLKSLVYEWEGITVDDFEVIAGNLSPHA